MRDGVIIGYNRPHPKRPNTKERGPEGLPRFRRGLRLRPWRPVVPAWRVCAVCVANLTRAMRITLPTDAVIEGRLLMGGMFLCNRHELVHLRELCRDCLSPVYAWRGRIWDVRLRQLRAETHFIDVTGHRIRQCPACLGELQ